MMACCDTFYFDLKTTAPVIWIVEITFRLIVRPSSEPANMLLLDKVLLHCNFHTSTVQDEYVVTTPSPYSVSNKEASYLHGPVISIGQRSAAVF